MRTTTAASSRSCAASTTSPSSSAKTMRASCAKSIRRGTRFSVKIARLRRPCRQETAAVSAGMVVGAKTNAAIAPTTEPRVPMMFHSGMRRLFLLVSEAIRRPVEGLLHI